jgi:hypothetical protein
VTRGEPDAVKVARPVREGGPGKRTRRNPGTAPGVDPHWLYGGRTDIDNMILICSYHHIAIHDHGYRIRRLAGRWEFLRPDGTPIPTTAAPLTGNTEGLIEMHTRARLRIDRTTLTPDWYGERLDPEPILDALLPRRVKTAA